MSDSRTTETCLEVTLSHSLRSEENWWLLAFMGTVSFSSMFSAGQEIQTFESVTGMNRGLVLQTSFYMKNLLALCFTWKAAPLKKAYRRTHTIKGKWKCKDLDSSIQDTLWQ